MIPHDPRRMCHHATHMVVFLNCPPTVPDRWLQTIFKNFLKINFQTGPSNIQGMVNFEVEPHHPKWVFHHDTHMVGIREAPSVFIGELVIIGGNFFFYLIVWWDIAIHSFPYVQIKAILMRMPHDPRRMCRNATYMAGFLEGPSTTPDRWR